MVQKLEPSLNVNLSNGITREDIWWEDMPGGQGLGSGGKSVRAKLLQSQNM